MSEHFSPKDSGPSSPEGEMSPTSVLSTNTAREFGEGALWGGRARRSLTWDEAGSSEKRATEKETYSKCPVCLDRAVDATLRPCGHDLCTWCRQALQPTRCPLCRTAFTGHVSYLQKLCMVQVARNVQHHVTFDREKVQSLPAHVRLQLLQSISNRRMVYGKTLRMMLEGSSMRELNLNHAVNADADDFFAIARMPNVQALESLDVTGCQKLTSASLAAILCRSVNITSLCLKGLQLSEDEGLLAAVAQLRRLTKLNLAECNPSYRSLDAFCGASSELRELNIENCSVVNDAIIARLAQRAAANLREVNFSGCARISAAALQELADHSPNLEKVAPCVGRFKKLKLLDMSLLRETGDDDLEVLLAGCGQHLVRLFLKGTNISDKTLNSLGYAEPQLCPVLTELDLSFCTT
ncbi:Transcription factor COE2, partial [Cymbomonas tetramitiformis]